MMKIEMNKEFAERLETNSELTLDIDKYLCYTNENMRFFNVDF